MSLFDIEKIKKELEELETQTLTEGFWENLTKSSEVLQKIKILKSKKKLI